MTDQDPKAVLHRYLRIALENLQWKQDELSEYDARRPLTPTGTNLLGLLKHIGTVMYGYFGDTFDRPHEDSLPWMTNGEPITATCGSPRRSRGSRSSPCINGPGHTAMRQSQRSLSTRPGEFHGDPSIAPTSPCSRSWCT